MSKNSSQEGRFDTTMARLMEGFGQRVSRRGVLARVGKLILSALGLSIVPHLPIDRSFTVEAQGDDCCLWQLCGINGYLCNTCCGNSGSLSNCPSCTGMVTGNNSWTKCCIDPSVCGSGLLVYYTDCCTPNQADSINCKGAHCPHNPAAPNAWCGGTGMFYACTFVQVFGACTPGINNPC